MWLSIKQGRKRPLDTPERNYWDRERELFLKSIHTSSWSETSKLSLVVLDKTSPKITRKGDITRWPSILYKKR